MMARDDLIPVTAAGRPLGEHHPRAKLTDHEVDLVHQLLVDGLSYTQVADKFGVSKSCIAHLATGRRRGQTPVAWVSPKAPRPANPANTRPSPTAALEEAAARLQAHLLASWR